MSGSHKAGVSGHKAVATGSTASRHPWVVFVLGALAVLLIGGAVVGVDRLVAGCGGEDSFTVAADPSIAPVVQQIVDDSSVDLGCADLAIQAVEPSEVLGAVGQGQGVPALWIPDSTQWLARAGQSTGMPVDVAADSLVASPAVVIGPEGKEPPVDRWIDTLTLAGLELGDPLTSSVSSAPIAASLAEVEADQSNPWVVSAAMVPIAQAQLSSPPQTDQAARIEQVLTDGGYSIVSEQQLVAHTSPVSAVVPDGRSIFLNYPLAVTEPTSRAHDQAKESALALAGLLTSAEGLAALSDAGFRTSDGAALSDGRGVGPAETIRLTDSSVVQSALRSYAVLALPTKALVIDDVSGSMAFQAGAETRMELTIKASETGIGLFPDSAQLGIWSFSTKLDGDKDYQELIPVRRMDADVDGGTHREALVAAVRSLEPEVGGGTGLYDSTLAAFREVKRTYDPTSINSVIVLTDGANDDPGSISLASLISTLKREQDPTQPVIIITIGITDDADAATLEKISEATGGASFVARDPADIPDVFVQALQNRAG